MNAKDHRKKSRKRRARRRVRNVILVALVVILTFLAVGMYSLHGRVKRREVFLNQHFIPEKAVRGIDVSSYQGEIDMERLKEYGISFIYMKATEGSTHQDALFAENWKRAKESGVPAGAYHYFSYTSGGDTQAQNFIETVGDLEGRLLPVVDVEYNGPEDEAPEVEDVRRELRVFMEAVEEEYGIRPMLYCHPGMYREYLKEDFGDCRKWMTSLNYPLGLMYLGDWEIWQYTDRGELPGVTSDAEVIDLDVLHRKTRLEELFVPTG